MSSDRAELEIDALKQQILAEVALHQRTAPVPRSLSMGIAMRLSHIETLLNTAETKAQPRQSLPLRFHRFPLNLSRKLQHLILKFYHFLFKEQRAVNLPLIQAARESMALNRQLAKDVVELQAQVEQLMQRLGELEQQGTVAELMPEHPEQESEFTKEDAARLLRMPSATAKLPQSD